MTVYFTPKALAGQEGNWVQPVPGKGWNTIMRGGDLRHAVKAVTKLNG